METSINLIMCVFEQYLGYIIPKRQAYYILGRTHGAQYRGYRYVPLRFGGNVVRRMGTQQHHTTEN